MRNRNAIKSDVNIVGPIPFKNHGNKISPTLITHTERFN